MRPNRNPAISISPCSRAREQTPRHAPESDLQAAQCAPGRGWDRWPPARSVVVDRGPAPLPFPPRHTAESAPPSREDHKAQGRRSSSAQNVVGVTMGIEHRVHAGQAVAQGLLAKIRAGVDHHHPLTPPSCQRSSRDGRSRRSCGSAEVHTAQSQPSVGTPIEVPVPRNVSSPSIIRVSSVCPAAAAAAAARPAA